MFSYSLLFYSSKNIQVSDELVKKRCSCMNPLNCPTSDCCSQNATSLRHSPTFQVRYSISHSQGFLSFQPIIDTFFHELSNVYTHIFYSSLLLKRASLLLTQKSQTEHTPWSQSQNASVAQWIAISPELHSVSNWYSSTNIIFLSLQPGVYVLIFFHPIKWNRSLV